MSFKDWIFKKENEEEQKNEKKENGIHKFLEKEGFYVVLFLCVCIVATTAVWVAKTNIDRLAVEDLEKPSLYENKDIGLNQPTQEQQSNQEPVVVVEAKEKATPASITPQTQSEQKTEKAEVKSETTATTVEKQQTKPVTQKTEKKVEVKTTTEKTAQPTKLTMKMPVLGTLGMKYAKDTLTYSKTLEQYATHPGVDLIADENTPVVAVLPGEVVEVFVDSRLGITIAIAHEDEMITRYSNLSLSTMVKVGDKVEQGQTISGIGQSALFESAEEPHLHFEVLIDGMNVDPAKYLPKKP